VNNYFSGIALPKHEIKCPTNENDFTELLLIFCLNKVYIFPLNLKEIFPVTCLEKNCISLSTSIFSEKISPANDGLFVVDGLFVHEGLYVYVQLT